MLRLIYGGFGSGKSTRVTELVREAIENADRYNKSIYLIVPEQDTVRAELEAAEKLPPYSALCFEVQNFSRLANTVFRAHGGLCYNYADSQAKILCMWQSIRSLGGLVSEVMEDVDEARITSMLSVIAELRAAGVDMARIEEASRTLGDESALGRELKDISLISTVYESKLSELYSDADLDIDRMCDILETNKYFSGCTIFIDGFSSFTAPQFRLIRRLISDGENVCVTLPCDRIRGKYSYTREIENTARALISYAEDMGVMVKCEDLSTFVRSEREDIRYVAENFYRKDAPAFEGRVENISFFEAADAREEAECVSAFIKKKVQEGCRYRDIAVVARNAPDYAGILDASFERHSIPCFFSCEVRPESHPVVKLIYGAFALYIKNCRREDVISYLKCGLCGVDPDDVDLFEKYVNSWKINGRRFLSSEPFTNNPGGYTDKKSAEYDYILERVNAVKDSLVSQLSPLFEDISGERSVRDICTALWSFLVRLSITEKLTLEAQSYAESGDEQSARESEGIYRCLCDTLDTLVLTVGEERVSASEYIKLLRLALKSKTVSVIPTSADAVTVGSAHMLRTSGIKHVFIIGASDGKFPYAVTDTGYFDAVKRSKLTELGIDLKREILSEVSNELFYYARAVCSASDSVTVMHSAVDTSGSAAKISTSTTALMKLLSQKEVKKISALDVCERVYDTASLVEIAMTSDPESADAHTSALIELASEGSVPPYELEKVLPPDVTDRLFGSKLNMSYSRFDSYVRCRFSYLCKYILKLEQTKEYDFEAVDVGNFVHDILDKLTGELTVDGKFRVNMTREELDTRVSRIAADYLSKVLPENDAGSTRLMRLISRIRHSVALISENICREFEQSEFTPFAHEMKIQPDAPFNPSPIEFTVKEGVQLSIGGTLDRADVYRRDGDVYVRVIDYKTGNKDFSLDDVKVGLNLQLLIYLFTLCSQKGEKFREMLGCAEDGRILPAGVLYYSASVKDVQDDMPLEREEALERAQSTLTRRGLLTNEESILRAMERDLGGKYIAVKEDKDTIKAKNKSVTLIEPDAFEEVRAETERVICDIARDMVEGHMEAAPLEYKGDVKCRYCEMRAVCRRYDDVSTHTSDDAE